MAKRATKRVGTTLLFENRRVRVWEMALHPGESSDRHLHANDYVFIYTSGGTKLAVFEGDATDDAEISSTRIGHVEFTYVGAGVRHQVKNVGTKTHREILVELKGASRTKRPKPPATND